MAANRNDTDIFWGEMHPCEHFVQIYGDDEVFLDSLASFVAAGLQAEREAAIVIATGEHLEGLERRLALRNVDVESARRNGRYVAKLAEDVLARFMVNGWPDSGQFDAAIGEIIEQAQSSGGGRVRAFGEMVAILWSRGLFTATLELEKLWSAMCRRKAFRLYCAYPRDQLTRNPSESIQEICRTHSLVLPELGIATAD